MAIILTLYSRQKISTHTDKSDNNISLINPTIHEHVNTYIPTVKSRCNATQEVSMYSILC